MIHDIQQSQQAYQTLIDDAQSMLNRAFPDPRFPDSSLRPAIAHIVAANRLLLEFEAVVINSVEENLQRCRNGEVDPNDGNNLFGAHIGYVAAVLQHPAITGLISVENEQDGQVSVNTSKMHNNLVQRPAILWKDVLEPLVYETEQAIG